MTSFLYRVMGASVLDRGAYEGIEADPRAFFQAVLVVAIASVSAGVGISTSGDGLGARILTAATIAVATWILWAALTLSVGVHLLPGRNTHTSFGELVRTLGFAAAPGCLQALAALTINKWPIFLVSWLWMIAASVVAVRQSLDYDSIGRAIAVCILAACIPVGLWVLLGTRLSAVW